MEIYNDFIALTEMSVYFLIYIKNRFVVRLNLANS